MVEIERRVTHMMIPRFGLDVSAVALDMTNFATCIDKADLAQRGKANSQNAAEGSCRWMFRCVELGNLISQPISVDRSLVVHNIWPVAEVQVRRHAQAITEEVDGCFRILPTDTFAIERPECVGRRFCADIYHTLLTPSGGSVVTR